MADNTPNYTDSMVEKLHAGYTPDAEETVRTAQVSALALDLGRNVRSIIAKLTREGLYVPKAKVPAGKAPVRKAQLVQLIADQLSVDVDVIGSLEKATKNTLLRIADALHSG